MAKRLVLSFIATDEPGQVEQITEAVAKSGGNWLESRMAHLAEKFAGIARISVPDDKAAALEGALAKCNWEGKKYVSHGSDNANAWSAGARLTCRNGKLVEVRWANCGIPERGNPCGWND